MEKLNSDRAHAFLGLLEYMLTFTAIVVLANLDEQEEKKEGAKTLGALGYFRTNQIPQVSEEVRI